MGLKPKNPQLKLGRNRRWTQILPLSVFTSHDFPIRVIRVASVQVRGYPWWQNGGSATSVNSPQSLKIIN